MSDDSERDDSGNRELDDEQRQAREEIDRIRADAADAITRKKKDPALTDPETRNPTP